MLKGIALEYSSNRKIIRGKRYDDPRCSAGETIFSIAASYGLPVNQIIADNGLSAETLCGCQSLALTFPSVVHTVLAGETLSSISQRYGASVRQLLRNNPQLRGRQDVYPGQTLRIEFSSKPIRTMAVNGYAYPFINRELLQRTLPYLTYITFFTYGFQPDGTLIGIDDEELIALSRRQASHRSCTSLL